MLVIVGLIGVCVLLWGRLLLFEHRARRVPSTVRVAQVRSGLGLVDPGEEVLIDPSVCRTLSIEMIKDVAHAEGYEYSEDRYARMGTSRSRLVLVFRRTEESR